MALPILCAFSLTCVASAQSDAATQEHFSSEVGWQRSPERRGTLDIILSCATTIIACTWSIQHLNVPGPEDKWYINLGRSAKWMLITVLLPEFILAHAVFELDMAIKAKKLVNSRLPENSNGTKSSIWKSALEAWKSVLSRTSRNGKPKVKTDAENLEWTLVHCYFANMGGLYYRETNDRNTPRRFPLTAFQYYEHYEALELTNFEEDIIKDKSKQDIFAKIVAVIQISYLALSIGVRQNRGLAYSQLEVVTLGFAVCGTVTYLFFWYKPQNVKVAINVVPKEQSAEQKPMTYRPKQDSFWKILKDDKTSGKETKVERICNDNIPKEPAQSTHAMLPVLSMFSAVFNCVHLLGWKSTFPTRVEGIVWQTSILCSILVPVLGLAVILMSQFTRKAGNPQEFINDCYQVLQAMAWQHSEQDKIRKAQEDLERACYSEKTDPERRIHFREIFSDEAATPASEIPPQSQRDDSETPTCPSDKVYTTKISKAPIRDAALDFIERKAPFNERTSLELADKFTDNFKRLIDHLNGDGDGTKRLVENARTYVFPRKSLVPHCINIGALYITSILYVASRFAILALALSSLRSLPEGVYVTTWTRNIPHLH